MADTTNEALAPWEKLSPKQLDIFNCKKRIVLVCGARKSGKTYAVLHRIVRHMWETPGARVAVFAKSVKLAKDAGCWQDLIERTIPEWIEAGIVGKNNFPLEFTTFDSTGAPGAKQDAQTRTAYFRIRNYWGGESEARLFSIDHDQEVEDKVKNKVFSLIYFIELSMFKDPRILTVSLPQLRMPHLRPQAGSEDDKQMWIADTNPDIEVGNRSWFYKVWYKDRMKKFGDSVEDQEAKIYYDSMALFELFLEDNPHLTKQEIIELKISCQDDPALYDSYVNGVHGDGAKKRNKLFAAWFKPHFHIIGGGQDEGDQIDVSDTSTILYGGWDIGSSLNHAAVILDRRIKEVNGVSLSTWCVLDEIISIDEQISLREITEQFMAKQDEIEKRYGRKFEWVHWSDNDALTVFRPNSESFDYLEILAHSHGRIRLQGVDKPKGSVLARIRLIKRILVDDRFFISSRCTKIIEMIVNARRDEAYEFVGDENKHPFDAVSYPIYMESRAEMLEASRPDATKPSDLPMIIGV